MSIWQKFLHLIGLRSKPSPRTYEISEGLQVTLATLAQHEGRPENELLLDLLAAGLTQYHTTDLLWGKWESLTPREKHVTALACLGYTNRQIAARLVVTEVTAKFHVRNVLQKFGVKDKAKLRQILAGWDFNAWI